MATDVVAIYPLNLGRRNHLKGVQFSPQNKEKRFPQPYRGAPFKTPEISRANGRLQLLRNSSARPSSTQYTSAFPSLLASISSDVSPRKPDRSPVGKLHEDLLTSSANKASLKINLRGSEVSSSVGARRGTKESHVTVKENMKEKNKFGEYENNKPPTDNRRVEKCFLSSRFSSERDLRTSWSNFENQRSINKHSNSISRAPPFGKNMRSLSLSHLNVGKVAESKRVRCFSASHRISDQRKAITNKPEHDMNENNESSARSRMVAKIKGPPLILSPSAQGDDRKVMGSNTAVIEARLTFPRHRQLPSRDKTTGSIAQSSASARKQTSVGRLSAIHRRKPEVAAASESGSKFNFNQEHKRSNTTSLHSSERTQNPARDRSDQTSKDAATSVAPAKENRVSPTDQSAVTSERSGQSDFKRGLRLLQDASDGKVGERNIDLLSSEQLVMRESIEKVQRWIKTLPKHFDAIHHVMPAVQQDY